MTFTIRIPDTGFTRGEVDLKTAQNLIAKKDYKGLRKLVTTLRKNANKKALARTEAAPAAAAAPAEAAAVTAAAATAAACTTCSSPKLN